MTVEREHQYFLHFFSGKDARDITIRIQRHLQLSCLPAGYVEAPHTASGILFTSHRIFIGVFAWIVGIFLHLRCQPFVHRHGILPDSRLVVAHPHQLLAVGTEHHSPVIAKLLFVHPVRNTVDHLIALAVFRHLTLGVVIEQFHEEYIVLTHKGNHRSVWREQGCLLGTVLREWHQFLIGNGIDIVFRRKGMTVNRFRIGLNQHTLTVRTHDVALYVIYLGSMNG